MNLTLKIWRQANKNTSGQLVSYSLKDVSPDMSFLEMMDKLNNELITKGEDAIAYDHDCREGICGSCGLYIDGRAHGPQRAVATCQLHMRSFSDGDTITIEPWRAKAFPIIKDLSVDRTSFDRIMDADDMFRKNRRCSDANAIPISKTVADEAMDAVAY